MWKANHQNFLIEFNRSKKLNVKNLFTLLLRHTEDYSYIFMNNILYESDDPYGLFVEQNEKILDVEIDWSTSDMHILDLYIDQTPMETMIAPLEVEEDGVHESDTFKWGSITLKVLHHIAFSLGLKTVSLTDKSKLHLSKTPLSNSFDLRCIRYLQERDSFYEDFGYALANVNENVLKDAKSRLNSYISELKKKYPNYVPLSNNLKLAIQSGLVEKKKLLKICGEINSIMDITDEGFNDMKRKITSNDLINDLVIEFEK